MNEEAEAPVEKPLKLVRDVDREIEKEALLKIRAALKGKKYLDVAEMAYGLFAAEREMVKITKPSDVAIAGAKYAARQQENFVVFNLDGSHSIISEYAVSLGTLNRTLIHPREVFKNAIKDNSAAVVVLHNHPSGHVEPSIEDMDITERLKKAGETIGIPVLDHCIVGVNKRTGQLMYSSELEMWEVNQLDKKVLDLGRERKEKEQKEMEY